MIEALGTVRARGYSLGASAQQPPSGQVSVESVVASTRQDFVSSRIRVDNLQDVAILEYRSSEGDILRQYPTQKQIEAFKEAERLADTGTQSSASAPPTNTDLFYLGPAQSTEATAPTPPTAPPTTPSVDAPSSASASAAYSSQSYVAASDTAQVSQSIVV